MILESESTSPVFVTNLLEELAPLEIADEKFYGHTVPPASAFVDPSCEPPLRLTNLEDGVTLVVEPTRSVRRTSGFVQVGISDKWRKEHPLDAKLPSLCPRDFFDPTPEQQVVVRPTTLRKAQLIESCEACNKEGR